MAGGLWRYGYSLMNQFNKLDPTNYYRVIHSQENPENFIGLENNEELIPLKGWEKIVKLPRILADRKFDVVHVTENLCPLFNNQSYKKIITIHDLMPLSLSQAADFKTRLYYKFYLPRALRRVDKIITISEYSKQELINLYNIKEEKIEVIYHGIDNIFSQEVDQKSLQIFKDKYQLDHPFLLFVGGINLRKNLKIVLEAYNSLSNSFKKEFKIILVGKAGAEAEGTRRLIQTLGLNESVRIIGKVSDKELPLFYKSASLFVFPSLNEGFGLPVIEAMAAGCPVISSNATCLPEISGGAALLLDPLRVEEWRDGIASVLSDQQLSQDLVKSGIVRAGQFNWQDSAKKHLEVYYS